MLCKIYFWVEILYTFWKWNVAFCAEEQKTVFQKSNFTKFSSKAKHLFQVEQFLQFDRISFWEKKYFQKQYFTFSTKLLVITKYLFILNKWEIYFWAQNLSQKQSIHLQTTFVWLRIIFVNIVLKCKLYFWVESNSHNPQKKKIICIAGKYFCEKYYCAMQKCFPFLEK